ncbi:MAG: type II toxin-antitoxin system VapC family toxin [Moorea sp. SIO4A3]|nr:type II toxin-antitoxin system VapC family toxin [Moorena sp. SIO4A3]
MKYLLDTNICIYIINRRPEQVLKRFRSLKAGDVAVSAITLYELLYGAYKSAKPAQNKEAVSLFVSPLEVLPFDEGAADVCGNLRAMLERSGDVIGAMDLQIAAIALVYNLTLISNNTTEFERICDLKLDNWL